jgi:hypothetical protein
VFNLVGERLDRLSEVLTGHEARIGIRSIEDQREPLTDRRSKVDAIAKLIRHTHEVDVPVSIRPRLTKDSRPLGRRPASNVDGSTREPGGDPSEPGIGTTLLAPAGDRGQRAVRGKSPIDRSVHV